ncbi:2OG-Fe dioxygenase family protein [Gluconacetobacter entanii]|uniref:2OG-Fe dioxygenase family protein n=1 Tax=Gluconacetobacter entanii TaxID=108528 RepID=A0ABT3K7T2_9PROT|nr:2OG-Fe dioxygenase family protein [Gluconacetobacter entanii]MCW4591470.1 2OG-Fe dioxygenase family protein [Gluconacetobacter entanii]MCW4593947.1 2OG-Fe dioxygenase family protein [Gluconacetobacter entanii]NPC90274.1 2OG-Fe dioxygenase family protein [Gluconacetobacter entanii]
MTPTPDPDPTLAAMEVPLRAQGFAFVGADRMHEELLRYGLREWESFAASWNRLGLDRYMADGGRYRRRRHATFAVGSQDMRRKKHQPHYQSRDYNELNGGIERWFRAVEPDIGTHPALQAILRLMYRIVTDLTPPARRPEGWHAEIHQFRIEALPEQPGHPTPEGLHRDGVDWVLVLMVRRENVMSGETTIHDLQRRQVGTFMLDRPLDAAIVDDNRVYHGVTAVRPIDPSRPAYRDVLVVTFRHQ